MCLVHRSTGTLSATFCGTRSGARGVQPVRRCSAIGTATTSRVHAAEERGTLSGAVVGACVDAPQETWPSYLQLMFCVLTSGARLRVPQ